MGAAVDKYFASVPADRKPLLAKLHSIIVGLYPNADVTMRYKMPTYEVGEGWVAVANQKHYVSLYTCGYHHIAQFKQRHPEIKTGKGCINLKPTDKLPVKAIEAVVRHAINHPIDE